MTSLTSSSAVEGLLLSLPEGVVVTDPQILAAYERDRELWSPSALPLALVRPTTTDQVVEVMRWASAHQVPVVPRGAGSGLTGAANATTGSIVLSLERLDRIVQIDHHDLCAVVQPGVLNADLKRAASAQGLFYAPDPASSEYCTLGGNVATNAGGLCCLKYGVTREAVLGLKVVLADGSVLSTGGRTVKDVAGLDLTSLFVGSEGQLGVITEITVRLVPLPEEPATLVATFDDLETAGEVVHQMVTTGRPSMCELMDQTTVRAVEAYRPSGLDTSAAALLLVQADDAAKETQIRHFAQLCERAGASFVMTTVDPEEGQLLTMARRVALEALESSGQWLLEDVGVPLSSIPDLVAGCQEIGEAYDLLVACFGHAGDGNMHPTIVFPQGDQDAEARARQAGESLVELALGLGGTVSGEHGIGQAKRSSMAHQVGAQHLDLQRQIKAVFDPAGLLNPGKSLA